MPHPDALIWQANFTSIAIETDSGTFTPFRLGFSGNRCCHWCTCCSNRACRVRPLTSSRFVVLSVLCRRSNQALAILTSMGSQLLSRIGAGKFPQALHCCPRCPLTSIAFRAFAGNVTTGGSGADISNMCALGKQQ